MIQNRRHKGPVPDTPELDAKEVPKVGYAGIWETVRACVGELLDISPNALSPETVLLDLGARSLDFIDLVFRLEREFDVGIPRSLAMPAGHTLRSYVTAVETGLANAAKGGPSFRSSSRRASD